MTAYEQQMLDALGRLDDRLKQVCRLLEFRAERLAVGWKASNEEQPVIAPSKPRATQCECGGAVVKRAGRPVCSVCARLV